jgi:hypothetical protein
VKLALFSVPALAPVLYWPRFRNLSRGFHADYGAPAAVVRFIPFFSSNKFTQTQCEVRSR